MRLIDLDQTIFVPIVDESKGGVEYEMEMTIGEMFDRFLGGFQPEIVDAVPVEWLRNLCAIAKMETDDEMFIDWLIQTWQKEQGAR